MAADQIRIDPFPSARSVVHSLSTAKAVAALSLQRRQRAPDNSRVDAKVVTDLHD
jgi:hypothetical protein